MVEDAVLDAGQEVRMRSRVQRAYDVRWKLIQQKIEATGGRLSEWPIRWTVDFAAFAVITICSCYSVAVVLLGWSSRHRSYRVIDTRVVHRKVNVSECLPVYQVLREYDDGEQSWVDL